MPDIRDVYEPNEPVEENAGLLTARSATREDLYAQRILRLMFMSPGEIFHRPTLGAGLQEFVGKPPLPDTIRKVRYRLAALYDSLDFVDDYAVTVTRRAASLVLIDQRVKINGAWFSLPEVDLGTA